MPGQKRESWHQKLVHARQLELQNKAWQCHPQSYLGNQKQWCKGFFRNWAGIVIQNPLTNDKSPMGNFEPMDRWMERDRWIGRQTANGPTYWQTDQGYCKKLHKIIFNLRPMWHLKLNPFWNERNLKRKVLINNQLFQSKPWIHEILQISATDKLVDIDPWNFDTKNVKQYTKGGKKEKYRVMTMRGTTSV